MNQENKAKEFTAALEQARGALEKLPILGPALWLYARDPVKKYLFMGDVDWALLPPVVLDQCRLFSRDGLPFAFVTWAQVNDLVDQRLRSGHPRVAPHEWNSGDHLWIIDAVAPFGQLEETLADLRASVFGSKHVSALLPNENGSGLAVREWPGRDEH